MSDLKVPDRGTKEAAGYDLILPDTIQLGPLEKRKWVPLGFHTEFPAVFEAFIVQRSSVYSKYGIEVFQGTIDSDYRGEWKLCLSNLDNAVKILSAGTKIAQVKFYPVLRQNYRLVPAVEQLLPSSRGTGGIGSTGLNCLL